MYQETKRTKSPDTDKYQVQKQSLLIPTITMISTLDFSIPIVQEVQVRCSFKHTVLFLTTTTTPKETKLKINNYGNFSLLYSFSLRITKYNVLLEYEPKRKR